MEIRPIEQHDNRGVKTLVQTSLKNVDLAVPGTAYFDQSLDDLYDFYQNETHGQYWVLSDQGQVVGGIGIGHFKEQTCELQKLYIAAAYQGQGLSKQLMNQALAFAAKYYQDCYLETHSKLIAAIHLYQKYGFQKLDQPLIGTAHSAMDTWFLKTLS
ncbi:GNAT family N-acetyltransferase [Pediococcus siamensis]|uniref:GNAT family N-acetyltransferase n=1 Tax=Pediococcus siamensis TaxID=381829 RepID=UPI0039A31E0B